MTENIPPEALEVARQERATLHHQPSPAETTIRDLAAVLHPDDAAARARYITKHLHHLRTHAYTGDDDALLDTLRTLHQQRERIDRATRLLLAYARTTPAIGSLYRLRDLADAAGVSISSARSMWDASTVEQINAALGRDAPGAGEVDETGEAAEAAGGHG